MKKAGDYRIPFLEGRMMEWTSAPEGRVRDKGGPAYRWGDPDEWRENKPFTAKLKVNGHWRGRSSARVGLLNEANGEKYSMGFASFYDAVVDGSCVGGYIEGTWAFRKQGANYILVRVTT